jgi:hypothetical protein
MNTLTIDVTFACTNNVVVIVEIRFFFYQKQLLLQRIWEDPNPNPF